MKPVLLDAGVIVALLDRSEKFHQSCADVVRIWSRLSSLGKLGFFKSPSSFHKTRTAWKHRLREYRGRKIDLADACLIRLADEFETADILTLDKDFEISLGKGQALPNPTEYQVSESAPLALAEACLLRSLLYSFVFPV